MPLAPDVLCLPDVTPQLPGVPSYKARAPPVGAGSDPGYMSRNLESLERINSIHETNGRFESCNSCKRLVSSRLHKLHETKFLFVSRIKFFRS